MMVPRDHVSTRNRGGRGVEIEMPIIKGNTVKGGSRGLIKFQTRNREGDVEEVEKAKKLEHFPLHEQGVCRFSGFVRCCCFETFIRTNQ
jgi:hypothetical protein